MSDPGRYIPPQSVEAAWEAVQQPGAGLHAALTAALPHIEPLIRADEQIKTDTARRIATMYQRKVKAMAAVLLDVRGMVRGSDAALDARIDEALGRYLPEQEATDGR